MKYKAGFSLVEVIICLMIVFVTLSLALFAVSSFKQNNNLYVRQYKCEVYEYNLIQIIKSDYSFIYHADKYIDTTLCTMNLNFTPPQIIIYLDKQQKQCDAGLYDAKYIINCTVTEYATYTKYYYSIQKYEKSTNNVDAKNGGIIYVTVFET